MIRILSLCIVCCFCNLMYAQSGSTAVKQASQIMVTTGMGFMAPGGDMAKRFGPNNQLTGGVHFYSAKRWTIGLDLRYFFGNQVREDVLAPLRNGDGNLIGINGQLASVVLRQRGYMLGPEFGYHFTKFGRKGANSLRISGSVGYLANWIRLQDDLNNFPQVAGIYNGGFNRLATGTGLHTSVGYLYRNYTGGVNVYLAAEVVYGMTKQQNAFQYDTGTFSPDDQRQDLMFGLKAVWMLPVKTFGDPAVIEY